MNPEVEAKQNDHPDKWVMREIPNKTWDAIRDKTPDEVIVAVNEHAALKKQNAKMLKALESIAGLDCINAAWKGNPCKICSSCIARKAMEAKS